MEPVYTRSTGRIHLQQILDLQEKNLAGNLTASEKAEQGFVTVVHTMELLERMNTACPHIIGLTGEQLIGYALCMHPIFAGAIPVLEPMFAQIRNLDIKEEDYMVMGQICVALEYRRKGVFKGLYHRMREVLYPNYRYIITEVDALNTRSLNAHASLGFRTLKVYLSSGQHWHLLLLETGE